MLKNLTIVILGIGILLILFWPKKPDPENPQIGILTEKIKVQKSTIKVMEDAAKIIKDKYLTMQRNHRVEIGKLKNKPVKELTVIKYKYIEKGSDSAELIQTVTKFKELDQCNAERNTLNELVKAKSIVVTNFKIQVTSLEDRADEVNKEMKARERSYTKEIRKTRIIAGASVGILILLLFFSLSG